MKDSLKYASHDKELLRDLQNISMHRIAEAEYLRDIL